MNKSEKHAYCSDLSSKFSDVNTLFLTQYSGMTVEDLTQFRKELNKVQAKFHVVKNSIVKKALQGTPKESLSQSFKGQIGVVFAHGDVAATAASLSAFLKKNEKIKLVCGYLDQSVINPGEVQAIASLPPREVLIAQIIGLLVAPHRNIMGVLQGVQRSWVYLLKAVGEKNQ
jgi:large subunit ribosomal protein L10